MLVYNLQTKKGFYDDLIRLFLLVFINYVFSLTEIVRNYNVSKVRLSVFQIRLF